MVAMGTFSWSLIGNLKTHARSSLVAVIATVATVVNTRHLTIGALVAVIVSVIDVSRAHIWKISSDQALDMAFIRSSGKGAGFELIGRKEASEKLVSKLAIHDTAGALDKLMAHRGKLS